MLTNDLPASHPQTPYIGHSRLAYLCGGGRVFYPHIRYYFSFHFLRWAGLRHKGKNASERNMETRALKRTLCEYSVSCWIKLCRPYCLFHEEHIDTQIFWCKYAKKQKLVHSSDSFVPTSCGYKKHLGIRTCLQSSSKGFPNLKFYSLLRTTVIYTVSVTWM